jgi:hypothetical protein
MAPAAVCYPKSTEKGALDAVSPGDSMVTVRGANRHVQQRRADDVSLCSNHVPEARIARDLRDASTALGRPTKAWGTSPNRAPRLRVVLTYALPRVGQ